GGIQSDVALRGEAMGSTADGLMFDGAGQNPDLGIIRELAFGDVQVIRPELYVQQAVRHQPMVMDSSLFVQHAVRASQLESLVRSAAVDAVNSAMPGYDSLLDTFARDAPNGEASSVKTADIEPSNVDQPA